MEYKYSYQKDSNNLILSVTQPGSNQVVFLKKYPTFYEDRVSGQLIEDETLISYGIMKDLNDVLGMEKYLQKEGIITPEDTVFLQPNYTAQEALEEIVSKSPSFDKFLNAVRYILPGYGVDSNSQEVRDILGIYENSAALDKLRQYYYTRGRELRLERNQQRKATIAQVNLDNIMYLAAEAEMRPDSTDFEVGGEVSFPSYSKEQFTKLIEQTRAYKEAYPNMQELITVSMGGGLIESMHQLYETLTTQLEIGKPIDVVLSDENIREKSTLGKLPVNIVREIITSVEKKEISTNPAAGPHIDKSFFIRNTLVDRDKFNALPEENRIKILQLRDDFNKLGYIEFTTQVGPDQLARMSNRQREKQSEITLKAFGIEDEIKQLLKSSDQVDQEKREQEIIKLKKSRVQIKRRLEDLTTIFKRQLESPRDNKYKKEVKENEDELSQVENKLREMGITDFSLGKYDYEQGGCPCANEYAAGGTTQYDSPLKDDEVFIRVNSHRARQKLDRAGIKYVVYASFRQGQFYAIKKDNLEKALAITGVSKAPQVRSILIKAWGGDNETKQLSTGGQPYAGTNAMPEHLADQVASRVVNKNKFTKNKSVDERAAIAVTITDELIEKANFMYLHNSHFRQSLHGTSPVHGRDKLEEYMESWANTFIDRGLYAVGGNVEQAQGAAGAIHTLGIKKDSTMSDVSKIKETPKNAGAMMELAEVMAEGGEVDISKELAKYPFDAAQKKFIENWYKRQPFSIEKAYTLSKKIQKYDNQPELDITHVAEAVGWLTSPEAFHKDSFMDLFNRKLDKPYVGRAERKVDLGIATNEEEKEYRRSLQLFKHLKELPDVAYNLLKVSNDRYFTSEDNDFTYGDLLSLNEKIIRQFHRDGAKTEDMAHAIHGEIEKLEEKEKKQSEMSSDRTARGINQDKNIKALSPGRRISEEGNVYYENRSNRSDKDRRKKFDEGGKIDRLSFGEPGILWENKYGRKAVVIEYDPDYVPKNTLVIYPQYSERPKEGSTFIAVEGKEGKGYAEVKQILHFKNFARTEYEPTDKYFVKYNGHYGASGVSYEEAMTIATQIADTIASDPKIVYVHIYNPLTEEYFNLSEHDSAYLSYIKMAEGGHIQTTFQTAKKQIKKSSNLSVGDYVSARHNSQTKAHWKNRNFTSNLSPDIYEVLKVNNKSIQVKSLSFGEVATVQNMQWHDFNDEVEYYVFDKKDIDAFKNT